MILPERRKKSMSLDVKDLSISLANGETVTEHISFQIKKGEMHL